MGKCPILMLNEWERTLNYVSCVSMSSAGLLSQKSPHFWENTSKKYHLFDSSLDNLVFNIALKIYELLMSSIKHKAIFIVKMFKGKSLWSFFKVLPSSYDPQKATV